MSPENAARLVTSAGSLMPPSPIDPRQNLMCFGFDCGDGWFHILDQLFRNIEFHKQNNAKESMANLQLTQVKEKFGTLRVYMSGYYPVIEGMISMAEAMSGVTCEDCGATPARTAGIGWITTLCAACAEAKGKVFLTEDEEE